MKRRSFVKKFQAFGVLGCWFATLSHGVPSRISSQLLDLGEVHKLYLSLGLASVVQLPYPITEVKIGSPSDVQAQISKTLPSELTLVLRRSGARPTNMIVRCGVRTFVFDLVPSTRTHQDVVRISGSYGSPRLIEPQAKLIDSSWSRTGATGDASDMELIASSREGFLTPVKKKTRVENRTQVGKGDGVSKLTQAGFGAPDLNSAPSQKASPGSNDIPVEVGSSVQNKAGGLKSAPAAKEAEAMDSTGMENVTSARKITPVRNSAPERRQ